MCVSYRGTEVAAYLCLKRKHKDKTLSVCEYNDKTLSVRTCVYSVNTKTRP